MVFCMSYPIKFLDKILHLLDLFLVKLQVVSITNKKTLTAYSVTKHIVS